MERMTKIDENIQTAQNMLSGIVERCYQLEEENKKLKEEIRKLKEAGKLYREDNKKLRAENEYLHKLLPEADGYIIEKQLEQRLWNDGEEDVYE